jgi:hypothetical protein
MKNEELREYKKKRSNKAETQIGCANNEEITK